ncbi:NAD(P)H-binding protein [Yinghuangia sp. ASG 101]|uniref:SDR family oxidoreductase n=1 Tax=Yinghuangia sp. ASG 101 TaxID=2896848 RepID=UPI001E5723B7|nr:NAD(P)H-binding protein [Yinghuangia sp. ASG 101]UGQ10146.1 NAD(P)H-binding protein [Yinghuangia sp. ASG 101]
MSENVILVTGATGLLGREVLERVRHAGVPVRAMTRKTDLPDDPGVRWVTADLQTGTDVAEALEGVTTVIHCASDTRKPKHDIPGWRHLIDAAREAGVRHIVNISIVGVDRTTYPYYKIKLEGELMLAESGIPWTNLRATQFPDLLDAVFRFMMRLPFVLVPSKTPCQPVDQGEVADRLVELALGAPAGQVAEMGGPKVYDAKELARTWLAAAGRKRPILPIHLPGTVGAVFRSGALTTPEHAVGVRTWEEFLAGKVADRATR